ncbi:MAG: hypothetical protein LBC89_01785 [Bacteroidales bacterium]|jgi:hypothetical protein|nr:hypothetical protein [Bacteroidales bacterium]
MSKKALPMQVMEAKKIMNLWKDLILSGFWAGKIEQRIQSLPIFWQRQGYNDLLSLPLPSILENCLINSELGKEKRSNLCFLMKNRLVLSFLFQKQYFLQPKTILCPNHQTCRLKIKKRQSF